MFVIANISERSNLIPDFEIASGYRPRNDGNNEGERFL